MSTKITTLEDLDALLAAAGLAAEPVVVREGFRIWTLAEDEYGEWWAWSWREEGEDGKPRRAKALWLPLTVLYAPGLASDRDRQAVAQAIAGMQGDYLPSPGLDPAWIAGWRAAMRHAASKIARANPLAPAPGERCWCGGPIGRREPGDARGLGCLDNITHALAITPTDGRVQG